MAKEERNFITKQILKRIAHRITATIHCCIMFQRAVESEPQLRHLSHPDHFVDLVTKESPAPFQRGLQVIKFALVSHIGVANGRVP